MIHKKEESEDTSDKDLSEKGVLTYANVYRTRAIAALEEKEAAKPPKERKNIKELRPNEDATKTLKTAIGKAISSGQYQKFVTIHSQYMFDLHSMFGSTRPNQRFLPWHRAYLVKFEEMLNNVMKMETGQDPNIAIPYWDWEHDQKLPEFLNDLTPKMDVEVYLWSRDGFPISHKVYSLTVRRFPGTIPGSNKLPTEQQVNRIRKESNYVRFMIKFELGPHGAVHNWVGGQNPAPDPTVDGLDDGGAMALINVSPLDFCFWCHHANIDRIWAEWQKNLEQAGNTSNIYPELNGNAGPTTNPRMDPWTDIMVDQTRNTEMMGYTYK
jgi:tyrosinase